VGYIEKTLEKKHFAPEKMLGDDPFLLAGPRKAVSFRDPGTPPLGSGEVGG